MGPRKRKTTSESANDLISKVNQAQAAQAQAARLAALQAQAAQAQAARLAAAQKQAAMVAQLAAQEKAGKERAAKYLKLVLEMQDFNKRKKPFVVERSQHPIAENIKFFRNELHKADIYTEFASICKKSPLVVISKDQAHECNVLNDHISDVFSNMERHVNAALYANDTTPSNIEGNTVVVSLLLQGFLIMHYIKSESNVHASWKLGFGNMLNKYCTTVFNQSSGQKQQSEAAAAAAAVNKV
eukprot:768373-Hanusia_phi.AAC.16